MITSYVSSAQVEMNNTKTVAVIKGSYIYNFAKNCKWDESFYEEKTFKIAVFGDKNLHDELLDKYSTKPLNNQIIEVVWVTDLELLFDEQIIFISESKKSELTKLSAIAEENSSLLVTDFDGALRGGSIINFIILNNTVSFDINIPQAQNNSVQLGTRMINWANKIVEK